MSTDVNRTERLNAASVLCNLSRAPIMIVVETHNRSNKRANEREGEVLQAHPVLATTISPTIQSDATTSVAPVLAPKDGLKTPFPFSFLAPVHASAVSGESDGSIAASCLPLTTPSPNLYCEDPLGQDLVLGLDNVPLSNIGPNIADVDHLMFSPRCFDDSSVISMHKNVDQPCFRDMYTNVDGTYTWIDDVGLHLLYSDQSCPQLSNGESLEWPEQQSSLEPLIVGKAISPFSKSSTAPSRDYSEFSKNSSDMLVIVKNNTQSPSLDENYSDSTPSISKQGHSSTKPIIPISPPQQPKPPTEPTNGTKVAPDQSLLHMAIDSGHEGIIRIILDQGVDINERNSDGSTALHMAVQKRQEKILPLLLEKGANANSVDGEGRTPIHIAICSDFQTGLKMLLGQKT